jgi:hypothetical protein
MAGKNNLKGFLKGSKYVTRKFRSLTKTQSNRALSKALLAGSRVVRDDARKRVPAKWKHLSKAIGAAQGKPEKGVAKSLRPSKVGWSVGKKKGVWSKKSPAATGEGRKGGYGKGVGIGPRNIKWFILGTKPRFTGFHRQTAKQKRTGDVYRKKNKIGVRYTGRIKLKWGRALRPIFRDALKATRKEVLKKIKESAVKDFRKILAKQRAKKKGK